MDTVEIVRVLYRPATYGQVENKEAKRCYTDTLKKLQREDNRLRRNLEATEHGTKYCRSPFVSVEGFWFPSPSLFSPATASSDGHGIDLLLAHIGG